MKVEVWQGENTVKQEIGVKERGSSLEQGSEGRGVKGGHVALKEGEFSSPRQSKHGLQ